MNMHMIAMNWTGVRAIQVQMKPPEPRENQWRPRRKMSIEEEKWEIRRKAPHGRGQAGGGEAVNGNDQFAGRV